MRICSLLPGATEILFALGLRDQVVGVTHECDYPPEARQKPVVVCSAIDPRRLSSSEIDREVGAVLAGVNQAPEFAGVLALAPGALWCAACVPLMWLAISPAGRVRAT